LNGITSASDAHRQAGRLNYLSGDPIRVGTAAQNGALWMDGLGGGIVWHEVESLLVVARIVMQPAAPTRF
jgi:hypothetical protein